MRRLSISFMVAAGALGVGATAEAATVSLVYLNGFPAMEYVAGPGEVNNATFSYESVMSVRSSALDVTDPGVFIRFVPKVGGPAGVCVALPGRATCRLAASGLEQVSAHLGDHDDRATTTVMMADIDGGPGADRIAASTGRISGGDGADSLTSLTDSFYSTLTMDGGNGNDTLAGSAEVFSSWARAVGGPGDDVVQTGVSGVHFVAGSGADTLTGPGNAWVDYGERTTGVHVTLDGVADDGTPGEGDNIAAATVHTITGGSGDDDLQLGADGSFLYGNAGDDVLRSTSGGDLKGGAGADRILGGPGPSTIDGGDGDDFIDPGAGVDRVYGDGGHDTVHVLDGFRDNVMCTDPDDVTADAFDATSAVCAVTIG